VTVLQLLIRMMLKIENMTIGLYFEIYLKKPLHFETINIPHIEKKSWGN
jgi:hypothetical protein